MNKLYDLSRDYGIELTAGQIDQFEMYTDRLLEYNEKVNLTAITDRDDILVKHYLDSLLPLHAYPFPQGAKVIDIGTGAGFPGIPLKIARNDLNLTLLDSLNKRLVFLRELSEALGQSNCVIHGRAEEFAHDPALREEFDIAVSRAVAALPSLVEYCLAYLKPGGVFLALKGLGWREDLEEAGKALVEMRGELEGVKEYLLPGGMSRSIIAFRKISQTPSRYPRKRVNILKTPMV